MSYWHQQYKWMKEINNISEKNGNAENYKYRQKTDKKLKEMFNDSI